MAEFGSMSKCIPITWFMLILYKAKRSEYIDHLRLGMEKIRHLHISRGNLNPG